MARVVPDGYTSPWGDAEPCPCGHPRTFAKCCKRAGQRWPRIELPGLEPPGPVTGYANPRCYMASTANCSRGKSHEHYISEAILQRFDHLKVSGMPWQAKGERAILPVKAMVANILCARHNGSLSPLDRLGASAFDAFVAASDYAVTQRHPGRIQHHLISGEALELWMIKLMAGVHFGGIAASEMTSSGSRLKRR